MRNFFLCLSVLILAVGGFGCQSSSSKNQVSVNPPLNLNIRDEPQTLDPRKARNLNGMVIIHMLFDGLTRVNQEGRASLSLASDVEISSDLKEYTFHLKEAFWTNGDKVTAFDFSYAWKKTLSPDFVSDTAFLLYVIKNAQAVKEGKMALDSVGIEVPDEKTLVVKLENPTPYFLELVASTVFFPVNQQIDEKNPTWTQEADTYVSNGPFKLVQWKHLDQLTVQKNEGYWDAQAVNLSSLILQIVNEETELKMFEKKELAWAGSPLSTLPLDALAFLKKEKQLKTQQGLGTYFIRTNTEFLPFTNLKIRKAFALAINRKEIIDHITQGDQNIATGIVPLSFGLQKEAYFKDGDVDNARSFFNEGLAELHLTKNQLPEIFYTYRMSNNNHLIAQAIQQQWYEAFGIRVQLEGLESKVFFNKVSKQDYHLAYGDWIADFADPINFLEVFKYKKGGCNNTLWENPEYAQLLDKSNQILDPQERFEILLQSEKILIENMPVIPILHTAMIYLKEPDLQDVLISSMGIIDFKWARLDSNH